MKVQKILLMLIIIIILIISLVYIFMPKKKTGLFLSGRLEGYETDIAPKVGGRIDYVVAREGAAVHKGELLVRMDDSDLQARLKSATSSVEIARQQQNQAKTQVGVVQTQFSQAQAQLSQSAANLELARININRYTNLLGTGAIPRRTYDTARTNYEAASSAQQAQLENVAAVSQQIQQAESQLKAAQANVKKAQADRQEILAQIAYMYVKSPINGIIIARTVEPGEVVALGKTLLTLLDLHTVYLRGYIPEGQIGCVRVGQKARVYLDSAPDKPLDAWVSEIDITASFTPENIYFRDDRVKQVFGVKLSINNPRGFAKPGMPADAEILRENDKNK